MLAIQEKQNLFPVQLEVLVVMSPLVKEREHFIGTFFYWVPAMIVLIISKEISEYLLFDDLSTKVFSMFTLVYTPVYVFILRRFYKKRCVTIFVEISLVFSIYSSMFLWCIHSDVRLFEALAYAFDIEEDVVKNILSIAYLLLIFEVVNVISKCEIKRIAIKGSEQEGSPRI
ncbi:hypothetical protein [Shewanella violacea]|uniref:Uncharacterized protein n=1 Tax=Shewanella violacea (strain JCM 10179 / CIP 106290 / LMG 19151 / DSS12) TaxID=637905 RepID=D4ZL34_SHEVD|nr:hypothetical protein [Shewanella violacea]BAJ02383.1 hypothetical protein SVI_2412 [Shewanella violacea DSS12]